MQIDPNTTVHRPRRALACLALLLALLLSAALSSGALARTARSGHKPSCSAAHHAKHATKHCTKRHAKHHKSKKPAAKPSAPAPKLTPAECEDGSAPVRSASGSYSCEDGSEPACEDGSDPIRPSAASAPMCRVPTSEAGLECRLAQAGGECGVEFACEDAEEATAAPQGCEHGSAFEEEPELDA